jgi:peptidyl-prolyl cis-trans isomerase C
MGCSLHQLRGLDRPRRVSVNGTAIAPDDIARETQNHPADKPLDAWRAAARALVIRELLLQEATRREVVAEPLCDAEGRRETNSEALIRQLIEQEIRTPQSDEEACRRFYENNRRRFRSPDLFEVRHILMAAAPDDGSARAARREQAGRVVAELQRDPGRFGEFARDLSACPSGRIGGSLGQIGPGQTVPEFEQALSTLSPASAGMIETRYGIHVVMVDRRIAGRELPFEQVRERIADWLTEKVRRVAIAQYLSILAGRAKIEGIDIAAAHSPLVQ